MNRFWMFKSRATIALAAILALSVVSAVRLSGVGLAQDAPPPKEQAEKKVEEKAEEKSEEKSPKRGEREKEPVKGEEKSEEKAPVKGEEKTEEKAPVKEEGKVPRKTEGKEPVKGEEKGPMKEEGDVPRKVEGKDPEGRPVPRKGDPEMSKDPLPGKGDPRKGDPEISKDPVPGRVRPVPSKEMKEPGEGKRPVPGKGDPKVSPKEVEKAEIEGLPEDFSDQQRQIYRELKEPELSFDEHYEYAKWEFGRRRELERNPALRYQPGKVRKGTRSLNTPCGNGEFEPPMNALNTVNPVDPAEWSGGYGAVLPNGVVDFANFTSGLLPGAINTFTAHQTIVSAGFDPNVPTLQMTGPSASGPPVSPNAVRIGNAMTGWGAELLSKTFTVTPSDTMIRFWYALVLENPTNHPTYAQPAFQVRVIESGVPVTGLVDLGNGSSKVVADVTNNPFFQSYPRPANSAGPLAYRDWSCAQIDLSTLVGKTVTLEFVIQDCAQGLHWGYAYIDNLCGTCDGSPTGNIAFDPDTSTLCGKGQVCFKYTLPTKQNAAGNVTTGTAVITLGIFQNGGLLQTLPTNPATLSADGTYCFPIDPATIPGLNPALGFDLVATGVFTLDGFNLPLSVGTVPNGITPGSNNDYNDPRICKGTPGTIVHDATASTVCGKGQICFNLRLPTMPDSNGNMITATGQIHLTLYQGGVAVVSLPASPVLSDQTGTSYCFPINPVSIPGLNPGGFDFVATAIFTFGTSGTPAQPATVGTVPNGIIDGQDNDYNDPKICDEIPKECGCCPGENLVVNGDFEQGTEIRSDYEWTSEYIKLFPGTYSVDNVGKIKRFCEHWTLPEKCKGTKNFSDSVLIVNGQTNQPAGSSAVIWEQQIVLPSDAGLKGADYRLCFRYLPLPQCCFDIPAKPYVLVNGGRIPLTDVCDEDTGCGHIYAATFHGGGTIHLQIVLPEDGRGDGNDLLIDNISVAKMGSVDSALVNFKIEAGTNANTADVTLLGALASPYTWYFEIWTGSYNGTSAGPASPPNVATHTFTNLNPDVQYYITLKVKSPCHKLTGKYGGWIYGDAFLRRAAAKLIDIPNPEPVKIPTRKIPEEEVIPGTPKRRAD